MRRQKLGFVVAVSGVALGPLAAAVAVRGLPSAPNAVFVWWVGLALLAAGAATWLILRFLPPHERMWRPAFAVSAGFVGVYAAAFPVAMFVLFFAPLFSLLWLVAAALGVAGTIGLHGGRLRGVWLSATPAAALGVMGVTVAGSAARGGWITLAGWAALDACAVLLLLSARVARRSGTEGASQDREISPSARSARQSV